MRKRNLILLSTTIALIGSLCSAAMAGNKPELKRSPYDLPLYICHRTTGPIKVDGILNEDSWKKAPTADFWLMGNSFKKATQNTTAKLCWDDKYLYVGFECADTNIYTRYTQHDDALFNDDAVEAFINPSGDLIHYFEFEVSPTNVTYDLKITNPTGNTHTTTYDASWECPGILTATKVIGTVNNDKDTDTGWSVEMAIPLKAFQGAPNCPPINGDRWRMNMFRCGEAPVNEYDNWSLILDPDASFHTPSRFGALVFKK